MSQLLENFLRPFNPDATDWGSVIKLSDEELTELSNGRLSTVDTNWNNCATAKIPICIPRGSNSRPKDEILVQLGCMFSDCWSNRKWKQFRLVYNTIQTYVELLTHIELDKLSKQVSGEVKDLEEEIEEKTNELKSKSQLREELISYFNESNKQSS